MNNLHRQYFRSFDVNFQVTASEPEVWNSLNEFLPFGSLSSQAQPEYSCQYSFERDDAGIYSLCSEAGVLRRSDKVGDVLEAFQADAQLYIAEHSPRGIFVHAGVVGWKNQALVFPGRSFHGKSTLVATLLKAGAIYYSDEYAIFDANGCVLPYPRDLSIRQELAENRRVHPRELNAATGEIPLTVGAIFICRFEANAIWNPQTLSPGEGLLALLDNTVAARSRTQEAMQILEKVAASSTTYQSVRGEAAELINEILN